MTIDINEILRELVNNLVEIDKLYNFPNLAGIYAIGLSTNNFPFPTENKVTSGSIIYIGKKTSLINESDKLAPKDTITLNSRLNKSLGEIILANSKDKPAARTYNKKKMRDYSFINKEEIELTTWMKKNLSISFYDYNMGKKKLGNLQLKLIEALNPILNTKENVSLNPNLSVLMELMNKCKQIARLDPKNIG